MNTGHLLLTALDHRAAAYEKLKQFQPALRDAKRMIETKPDSSKVSYTTRELVDIN
jgi:F-box/TPR repeat protein Pof3